MMYAALQFLSEIPGYKKKSWATEQPKTHKKCEIKRSHSVTALCEVISKQSTSTTKMWENNASNSCNQTRSAMPVWASIARIYRIFYYGEISSQKS